MIRQYLHCLNSGLKLTSKMYLNLKNTWKTEDQENLEHLEDQPSLEDILSPLS